MREDTVQTGHQETPARAAGFLSAALTFLLTFLFFAAPLQLSARSNQPPARQFEEETHEGSVKESRLVISSWWKAPHRCPRALARPGARIVFRPSRELRSDLSERWDAHSDRRRGPPPSLPLS